MTRGGEEGTGTVFLVGAGPGDPGLITVKGAQCLRSADVVLYDRLVDRRLLAMAPPHAELIDVGKVRGDRPDRQDGINALLIEKARAGGRVVRLKGGDPFVFGRGGEEAAALSEAGVPYQVVPGVTSAVAAPAYAGIPLTHRGYASSFTVVTGSEAPGKDDSAIAWDKLAGLGGTIVVLMGWERLEEIVGTLVREGRPADTPAAVIQWGSEAYQRTVVGTLADIVERARESGIAPPVAVVIGDVVRLRRQAELVRLPATVRQAGVGHPFQDPGERAGRAAVARGGRGRRGAHHRGPSAGGHGRAGRRRPQRFAVPLGRVHQR